MALPTFHFYKDIGEGTNNSLISVWMPILHGLLIDAGWTCPYIDSDAIGSGTSGSPAWDKTPAINTDAGVAVYQMPLNGHATQWFVKLVPGWGSNAGYLNFRTIEVGDAHDGSGTVSGGPPSLGTNNSASNNGEAFMINASEDGFAIVITDASSGFFLTFVERPRLADGTVTDDLAASVCCGTSGNHALLSASVGTVHTLRPALMSALNGYTSTAFGASDSMEARDGSYIAILGPYIQKGYPLMTMRGVALLSIGSAGLDATLALNVDGGNKTYNTSFRSANAYLPAFATE